MEPDVQAFEQLRAAGEFGPLHVHALGGEAFFQSAFGFEQHQGAVFLIADSQRFGLGLSDGAEGLQPLQTERPDHDAK